MKRTLQEALLFQSYVVNLTVFAENGCLSCWLQQIGHLPYDSYGYQEVELKNTIEIN